MWPEVDLKHFRPHKNIFLGSRKSIWGPKRPISEIYESYEINLAILGFSGWGTHLIDIFLVYVMGNVARIEAF